MISPHEMIEKYGGLVDQAMQSWFKEHPSTIPAYAMAEYHLGWRDETLKQMKSPQGKMLRPVLTLLSYQVFREDFEKAVPLACAIELYHNHTLIFDDMQDGDEFRRGRKTVWNLWGIGQGINAGLILGYLAYEFALQLEKPEKPGHFPFKIQSMFKHLNEAMLEVAEGQSLDLDFEIKTDVPPDRYLEMIGKKTGALISLCTFGGAFLAQDNDAISEKFKMFGRKLGVAMQIRDDLIGIWGASKASGKEEAKDLRRKKKTFPIFKAFTSLKGNDLELLRNYFHDSAPPEDAVVSKIVAIFEQKGVREACEKEAAALMSDVFSTLHESGIDSGRLTQLEAFSRHAFDTIGTLRQVASHA